MKTSPTVHSDRPTREGLLADYRDLKQRPRARGDDPRFFIGEGKLVVRRMLLSDYAVRSVVIEDGREEDLPELASRPEVPVFRLSRSQIQEIAGFNFHRGFLASADRRSPEPLERYEPQPLSLGFIDVQDMENMGSLIRSAAAFGIRQILIDRRSVDPLSRRVLRVSMGAALAMRFVRIDPAARSLARLNESGAVSLATTLDAAADPIGNFAAHPDPLILLLGNEASGLPNSVQRAASHRVTIPMRVQSGDKGLIDSLNVSVAGAICLHELTR